MHSYIYHSISEYFIIKENVGFFSMQKINFTSSLFIN